MVLSRGSATATPTSTSASQTRNATRWPTAWPRISVKAGSDQAEFDERVAQAVNAKSGRHGRRGGFRARAREKTWLTVGVITAIVVYAAGMLSRSRAARDK